MSRRDDMKYAPTTSVQEDMMHEYVCASSEDASRPVSRTHQPLNGVSYGLSTYSGMQLYPAEVV